MGGGGGGEAGAAVIAIPLRAPTWPGSCADFASLKYTDLESFDLLQLTS